MDLFLLNDCFGYQLLGIFFFRLPFTSVLLCDVSIQLVTFVRHCDRGYLEEEFASSSFTTFTNLFNVCACTHGCVYTRMCTCVPSHMGSKDCTTTIKLGAKAPLPDEPFLWPWFILIHSLRVQSTMTGKTWVEFVAGMDEL